MRRGGEGARGEAGPRTGTAAATDLVSRPQTFLISCGGTGGHLAPGIALAEELAARGHRVTLLISEKQVDARLAGQYPALEFRRIPGAPFSPSPRGLVRFGVQQARGLLFAYRQIRRLRPSVVVGFGGFTSAAVIVVGAIMGVPVALHEANRVPGRAIRTMAPLARRVYLPVGVTVKNALAGTVRFAGLPVRREIQRLERAEACAVWGLDPAQAVVAILGGSQGASGLNEWARREAGPLAAKGVQLVCVTGPGRGGDETLTLSGPAGRPVMVRFIPFCDRMAALLSAADLVISRAGAGTIAELVRCRVPAVLVPYPHAADNHQAANAAELVRQGGAEVLQQDDVPDGLTPLVDALLAAPERRAAMRAQLAILDRHDPLQLIANDLEQCGRGRERVVEAEGRPALA